MQRVRFSPRLGIRLVLLLLSVALAAWLGGCTEAAAPTEAPAAEAASPLSPVASPLPTPTSVPAISSSEGTGVITGRLLLILEDGRIVPVPDVVMAAAEVLTNDQGEEKVVGYDRTGSPKDQTDENGFFAIVDVPPGRYGLILDTVMTSFLLSMPDQSGDMLITIEPGTQADMGELTYDMLPLVNLPPGAQ